MLTNVIPKLPMRNITATKEFYINKLGFSEISDYGDYLLIGKDNIELHFSPLKNLIQKQIMDKCISEQAISTHFMKRSCLIKSRFIQTDN